MRSLLLFIVAGAAFIAFALEAEWVLSGWVIATGVLALSLIIGLLWARAAGRAQLSTLLVCWFFLWLSGAVFARWGTVEAAYEGSFQPSAYCEALFWGLLVVVIAVCARQGLFDFRHGWSTSAKYAVAFTGWAALSCVYAPRPALAAAWVLKLSLVVVLTYLMAAYVRFSEDVILWYRVTCLGLLCALVQPAIAFVSDPDRAFGSGRLESVYHPVSASMHSALVLLFALIVFYIERSRWALVVSGVAGVLMLLGGGKTAIAALVLAAIMFFLSQRKVGAMLGFLVLAGALGALILAHSPVGGYMAEYFESGQTTSLSGRTGLWESAWPLIKASPILGHGYLASKFVSLELGLDWEAGHLHNAVLDVLYNLGIPGLLLVTAMVVRFFRNLRTLSRRKLKMPAAAIRAGMWALLTFTLVSALTEPVIGSQADPLFIIFLAALFLSENMAHTPHGRAIAIQAAPIARVAVEVP